jgi:hypothetical protein
MRADRYHEANGRFLQLCERASEKDPGKILKQTFFFFAIYITEVSGL